MTVKQLIEKIVEGGIQNFYILDADNFTIVKARTLVQMDEEGQIYFTVEEIFPAICVFIEEGGKVLSDDAWHYSDPVYLDKKDQVFETLGELESSDYYKEAMVKALYKRI